MEEEMIQNEAAPERKIKRARSTKPKDVEVEKETKTVKSRYLQPVIIDGKERLVTQATLNALARDPKKEIEIPKGTSYVVKKCEGCK